MERAAQKAPGRGPGADASPSPACRDGRRDADGRGGGDLREPAGGHFVFCWDGGAREPPGQQRSRAQGGAEPHALLTLAEALGPPPALGCGKGARGHPAGLPLAQLGRAGPPAGRRVRGAGTNGDCQEPGWDSPWSQVRREQDTPCSAHGGGPWGASLGGTLAQRLTTLAQAATGGGDATCLPSAGMALTCHKLQSPPLGCARGQLLGPPSYLCCGGRA